MPVGQHRLTARAAGLLLVATASACSAGGGASQVGGAAPVADGWRQVWADEFTAAAVDPRKWQVEDRSTFGDGNLELACLMDRPANVSVSGGELHLTARREPQPLPCGGSDDRFPHGRSYSSAMVSTRGLASWASGRLEIRARLPTAPGRSKGLWPALWLRPVDGGAGEIDVMEALGSDAPTAATSIHQTFWTGSSGAMTKESTTAALPSGTSDSAFHVYGVEWSRQSLAFSIDGHVTFRRTDQQVPQIATVFGRPFFLRLNVAVGGRWPGAPVASTALPASMDVDYVRVFQRPG